VFVYHYSDLRTSAKELLTKYFDALFYIANWGTTRLRQLREKYPRRRAMLQRLDKARLP